MKIGRPEDFTLRFAPHRGIPGISKTSVWRSWKEVRDRIRRSSLRDVVDYIEFDIEPDKWIGLLLGDLRTGRYQPASPRRFPLGKSKGFSRWMTLPDIRDLVVFHVIATQVVPRALRHHRIPEHVYFLRDQISKAQAAALHAVRTPSPTVPLEAASAAADYVAASKTSYNNWLRFHQYRKWLLFEEVYPYIVKTDVSNFFDSIAHTQIEAVLFELGFQRNVVGLLLLLLERLAVRDSYSAIPGVGIPVDEFDCSRCLAHAVLFPHDERMVELVGEAAYVRWMDDLVFGLSTEADCYRLLAALNESLRRMHLTPNASKTKIMTLAEARRDFFFVTNDRLDKIDQVLGKKASPSARQLAKLRKTFLSAWHAALRDEDRGEWGKILKRGYRLAARLRLRALVARAHRDATTDPGLASNVAAYLRCVCGVAEFVRRTKAILVDPRNVYDDVRRAFGEELLRIEPKTRTDKALMRRFALDALAGEKKAPLPGDVAPLLVLRFCDKRSVSRLRSMLQSEPRAETARARAFVLASYGHKHRQEVIDLAKQTLHGPLGIVASVLLEFEAAPNPKRLGRLNRRLSLRFDAAHGRQFVDMRSILQARLMCANPTAEASVVQHVASTWSAPAVSRFEIQLLTTLGLLR
jgi:hypothetical protein